MRQKLFFLILALTTFITAQAYDFQVDDLFYNITSDNEPYTVEVTFEKNYQHSSRYPDLSTAEIPETVENGGKTYSVTSIGTFAFEYCSGLTSVTIPNSVTSIGSFAFEYCSGLTSVTIPNSVTNIGDYAFRSCSGLTTITIPNSVTSIGSEAFADCSGLTSVTIPNSVTSIGYDAFYGVRHINYNGSATGSPWGAYSINGITDGDFVYSDADKKTLIAYIGTGGNVTIPNSVTSIGSGAFSGCSGLTSVTIPNSVTSIGDYAFYDCSGLTSVTIPNSVTSIGDLAFADCRGLTSVTIPNSVTSIGSGAFSGCSGLTSVTIPNLVTSIGSYAFSGVRHINYNGSATGSPWGAYSINGITDGDFVYSDADKETLIAYIGTGGNVTIPNSVTSIGYDAFSGCSGLTSVTIPNSVTSIGEGAFSNCSGLTSVTIPNSVTSIGYGAFYDCSGLTSVTIPNSVTSIGSSAFWRCSNLTIRCEASSQPDGWSDFWNDENRPVVWGYVGISESIASIVKIYAHHNVIVVENADAEIGIFDATGRCVARSEARHVSMAMPRQGLYIVKVGAIATRVVVAQN